MALFDMPLPELRKYRPEREEPADFDAFWKRTLDEAAAVAGEPVFTPFDAALPLFEVFDVRWGDYDGGCGAAAGVVGGDDRCAVFGALSACADFDG